MTIDGLVCKTRYLLQCHIYLIHQQDQFYWPVLRLSYLEHNHCTYNLEHTLSERSLNNFIHKSEVNISTRREEAPVIVIVIGSPRGCTSESSIGCSVGGSDPLLEEGGGDGSDDVAATRVSTGVE